MLRRMPQNIFILINILNSIRIKVHQAELSDQAELLNQAELSDEISNNNYNNEKLVE